MGKGNISVVEVLRSREQIYMRFTLWVQRKADLSLQVNQALPEVVVRGLRLHCNLATPFLLCTLAIFRRVYISLICSILL